MGRFHLNYAGLIKCVITKLTIISVLNLQLHGLTKQPWMMSGAFNFTLILTNSNEPTNQCTLDTTIATEIDQVLRI